MNKENIHPGNSPDPLAVLEVIRDAPASERELAEILDLHRPQTRQLARLLHRFQALGIIRARGKSFAWADSQRVHLGIIRQRRRKSIFFVPSDRDLNWSAKVDSEQTGGAFDSDLVLASVRTVNSSLREARIEMVLKRGQLKIVGRLHLAYRLAFVESLDEKFPFDIDVTPGEQFSDGAIVTVAIDTYPSPHHHPSGTIIEQLGNFSSDPGLDIEIIIRKHDLPHQFPPEVMAELESLSDGVNIDAQRLDLRQESIVTIDGETARDFDDAVCVRRLDNGNYELGVHIADVASYVAPGTALDDEARLRGTSVYFPEKAIPMLPEVLSNGLCSLNPGVNRLTVSAIMEIDAKGQVVGYSLNRSVIHSKARMTYTEVNQILSSADPELNQKYDHLIESFQLMRELSQVLIRMRSERGAIDFNLPEAVFHFNDEGQIAGVAKAERNSAHRIIEEFMLLANETVANHLERLGVPGVYRVHEQPDPRRVAEFAELAATFGYRFPVDGVRSSDFQRISHLLEGKPEEKILTYAMLRSLQRARYASDNLGHFGLASRSYTHFTSPIRRYPDLVVHRLLHAILERDKELGTSAALRKDGRPRRDISAVIEKPELEQIARESSERERAADAAEMELEEWRKAMLMSQHVGETFEGMIVSVHDFGFFVELADIFVEGLVSVSSMMDDFYSYDSRRHALVGRQGRKVFRIGDAVKVRVARVNTDRHLIDLEILASQSRAGTGRKGSRRQR